MSTQPTLVGPTQTQQVNRSLFVGKGYLLTIQNAVDFAAQNNDHRFLVVIPAGYTGTDTIASIVRGTATIAITDQRTPQWQNYSWNGTAYVPADFVQLGNITTTSGTVTAANALISGNVNAGTATIAGTVTATNGDFVNVNATTAALQNASVTGDLTATAATVDTIAVTGELVGDLAVTGDLTVGGDVSADTADFDECNVDNSPVRTFANTPGGPGQGMVWPSPGIPVSEGDSWQDPSIDPATLATWPPSGVPQSTGTAWGASIVAATIPRTNAFNTFTQQQIINGNFVCNGLVTVSPPGGAVTLSSQGLQISWNTQAGQGKTDFINSRGSGGGGFSWYDGAAGSVVDTSTVPLMVLAPNGTLSTSGPSIFQNVFQISDGTLAAVATRGSIHVATSNMMLNSPSAGALFLNYDQGTNGVQFGNGAGAIVASVNSAGAATFTGITTPLVHPSGTGNLTLNGPPTGGNILLNWNSVGGVIFGNGTGTTVASFTSTGVFTATQKNFRIVHPTDENKHLTHATIEGPEIAVFYRGEGKTDASATATVTLPDYFEALTRAEGRTVLLTELFEDDDDTELGKLAASRVKDGKFRVRSEFASQKFYWEVKAVRADVEPLEVITDFTDDEHLPYAQRRTTKKVK